MSCSFPPRSQFSDVLVVLRAVNIRHIMIRKPTLHAMTYSEKETRSNSIFSWKTKQQQLSTPIQQQQRVKTKHDTKTNIQNKMLYLFNQAYCDFYRNNLSFLHTSFNKVSIF